MRPLKGTLASIAETSAVGSRLAETLERKTGFTVTSFVVAALALGAYLLARRIGNPAMYLLAYVLMAVIAAALVLARRRLAVEADRSDLPRRIREGRAVDVELRLHARRRVSTIVLEEELPPALGTSARVPVPMLVAGGTVSHLYTTTPKLRGVYNVGPLVATWSDPFGFTKRRAVLAEPVEIIVHPTTELVHDRVLSRAWEDPPIRPPVSKPWPTGFEFYGMRDYEPGDDPRTIVWRATARTLDAEGQGRYLVRVAEQGITDRVSVLIDNDSEWQSPGAPSETFETAVRVVASVGAKHLKDGFSLTVDSNERTLVKSIRGGQARIALLDELARLQPAKVTLGEALDRVLLNPSRDTHLVVVTPYIDRDAATRLRLLLDRGVSILLALVLWEASEPDSLHRAGSLGCNVVEVTAGASLQATFSRILSAGGRR